jgi:hypothetical protein
MRDLLLILTLGATACTARASRSTLPVQYSCGDVAVTRDVTGLHIGNEPAANRIRLRWSDSSGDHFVASPQSPSEAAAIEVVVPTDNRADATERVYDTSTGTSMADWRLLKLQVCTAHGGYTDALTRFAKGADFDQVANDLSLGRNEARGLVHRAMLDLQRRYYANR